MTPTEHVDRFQRRHPAAGFPIAVLYKYVDDQGAYLAALLTYYGFVSLFPLLLLLATVLGFVLDGNPRLQQEVLHSALSQFPLIGEPAVAVCAQHSPDVVLMDIRMPGMSGVEATRRILAAGPGTGVLVVTMVEDDTSVFAAMRAGARGYVLKGAAPDDIVRAVVAVAAGDTVFGRDFGARMARFFGNGIQLGPGRAAELSHPFPGLSLRERDILELVAEGATNAAIADRLALSEKTVRNNVSAVFAKLAVPDRPTAIVRAREAGLGGEFAR